MALWKYQANVSEVRLRGWLTEVMSNLRVNGIDMQALEVCCAFICDVKGLFSTPQALGADRCSNEHS